MSRSHRATRWEEKNMSAQCYGCNISNKGEQYKHWKYLDERWGHGTAEEMYQLSQTLQKVDQNYLQSIIDLYNNKLLALWTPENTPSESEDPQYRLSL